MDQASIAARNNNVIKSLMNGQSVEEISEANNISPRMIDRLAKRARGRQGFAESCEQVKNLADKGLCIEEIAEKMGRSYSNVWQIVRTLGIKTRRKQIKRQTSPASATIIATYLLATDKNKTRKEIAAVAGTSRQYVDQIAQAMRTMGYLVDEGNEGNK